MSPFYKRVSIETLMSSNSMAQLPSTQSPPKRVRIYSRIFFLLTNFLIIYMQLIFSCYCWDQMSFLSDVKLVAQILGLVILIITLILTPCRLLTNNTVTNAQIFPGGNLAGSDGITRGSQDIIQMIAVNLNPIWPSKTIPTTLELPI